MKLGKNRLLRVILAFIAAVIAGALTQTLGDNWLATVLVFVLVVASYCLYELGVTATGRGLAKHSKALQDSLSRVRKEVSTSTYHAREAANAARQSLTQGQQGRRQDTLDDNAGLNSDRDLILRQLDAVNRLEALAAANEKKAIAGAGVSKTAVDVGDQARTFVEFKPWYESPRRKDLTVATILDDFSDISFRFEWKSVRLTPLNWLDELRSAKPHMLFVESAWHGNGDAWEGMIVGRKGPADELKDLVTWCKSAGVPTVFWNKEDPAHYADFIEAAKLFDYVFTTDKKCVNKYKSDLGHDRVHVLEFAAQPAVHNPAKLNKSERNGNVAFAGTYFSHKFKSRREQMDILLHGALEAANKTGCSLEIFSRFQADPKYHFPEPFNQNIVGSLNYMEMLSAYKEYSVFLNVNTVTESPTMCARRIFELTASGAPVVTTPSKAIANLFKDDEISVADSQKSAEIKTRILVQSPEYADRIVHRGQREIWRAHTYAHRVESVLKAALPAKARSMSRKPMSVLAPTNRPEHVPNIFENFARQNFGMKELVLVTNGFEIPELELDRLKQKNELDNVKVVYAEEGLSLGACLNLGIARADGSIVTKMDDDDYYAPEYLGDMAYALRYSRAEVVGKRSHFMYLSGSSQLILRLPGEDHLFTDFVIGPTLTASKSLLTEIPFEDRTRGEDSSFLKNVKAAGGTIYAADKFNFCQFRGSHEHTWKVHDEALLATARVVSYGDPRATVTV